MSLGGEVQSCIIDWPYPFPTCPPVQPQIVPLPVVIQPTPVQTFTWPTRLSDADVDRIARRVVELLDARRSACGVP